MNSLSNSSNPTNPRNPTSHVGRLRELASLRQDRLQTIAAISQKIQDADRFSQAGQYVTATQTLHQALSDSESLLQSIPNPDDSPEATQIQTHITTIKAALQTTVQGMSQRPVTSVAALYSTELEHRRLEIMALSDSRDAEAQLRSQLQSELAEAQAIIAVRNSGITVLAEESRLQAHAESTAVQALQSELAEARAAIAVRNSGITVLAEESRLQAHAESTAVQALQSELAEARAETAQQAQLVATTRTYFTTAFNTEAAIAREARTELEQARRALDNTQVHRDSASDSSDSITVSDALDDTPGVADLQGVIVENANPRPSVEQLFEIVKSGDLAGLNQAIQSGITLNCCNRNKEPLLWVAAKYGHFDLVKRIVQKCPASVAVINDSAIGNATQRIQRGDMQAITQLMTLMEIEDDDAADNKTSTPLYSAAKHGHGRIVRFLAKKAPETLMQASAISKNTPLHAAVACGDLDTVRFIVNHNSASLKKANLVGETPLHVAIKAQQNACLAFIINQNPSAVLDVDPRGDTLLHYAARHGTATGVTQLLDALDDTDDTLIRKYNANGLTPLLIACQKNATEIAMILINRVPASLDQAVLQRGRPAPLLDTLLRVFEEEPVSQVGNTGLHIAVETKNLDLITLLAEKSPALMHAKNRAGETPLAHAVLYGYTDCFERMVQQAPDKRKLAGVIQLLTEAYFKTPVARRDSAVGDRLLFRAILDGNLDAVTLFSRQSPRQLAVSKNGMTPLWVAALKGNAAILELIIEKAPETVGIPSLGGLTPVYAAAVQNHVDCVVLLANASPESVRMPTDNGITPLWIAAKKGYLAVVRCLASHAPACLTQPDQAGVTPLAIAQQGGHNRVVRFLESKL